MSSVNACLATHEGVSYLKIERLPYHGSTEIFTFVFEDESTVDISKKDLMDMTSNFMLWDYKIPKTLCHYEPRKKAGEWVRNQDVPSLLNSLPQSFEGRAQAVEWARQNGLTSFDEDGDEVVADIFSQAYSVEVIEYDEEIVWDIELTIYENYNPAPRVNFSWKTLPGVEGWNKTVEFIHYAPCYMDTMEILHMFANRIKAMRDENNRKIDKGVYDHSNELSVYPLRGKAFDIKSTRIQGNDLWDLRDKVEAWEKETWEWIEGRMINITCSVCNGEGVVAFNLAPKEHERYLILLSAMRQIKNDSRGNTIGYRIASRALKDISNLED